MVYNGFIMATFIPESIKGFITANTGDVLTIEEELIYDEKNILSTAFNFLEHTNVINGRWDGWLFLTNKRLLIRTVPGEKNYTSLESVKVDIVNSTNLFVNGVKNKFQVDKSSDPYIKLNLGDIEYCFWLKNYSSNPQPGTTGWEKFGGDNTYFGLYLLTNELKNNPQENLQNMLDIYYYRSNSRYPTLMVSSFAIFPVTFIMGLIVGVVSNRWQYLGSFIFLGMILTVILFIIFMTLSLNSKKQYDISLREDAKKIFGGEATSI